MDRLRAFGRAVAKGHVEFAVGTRNDLERADDQVLVVERHVHVASAPAARAAARLIRERTLDPEEGQDHQFPVADNVKRVRDTSKVLEPESADGGRISGRIPAERGQEDKQGSEVRHDRVARGIIGPIEEWDQLGISSPYHSCRG